MYIGFIDPLSIAILFPRKIGWHMESSSDICEAVKMFSSVFPCIVSSMLAIFSGTVLLADYLHLLPLMLTVL